MDSDPLREAARMLGRRGRGDAKRRGDADYYRALAALRTHPGRKAKPPAQNPPNKIPGAEPQQPTNE